MLKIEGKHEMPEYLELLNTSRTIYMDRDRLHEAYIESRNKKDDLLSLASLLLSIESAGKFTLASKDNIIKFLLSINVDLDKRFANKKTKGYSLDAKRVIEPLIEAGIAVDLLKAYKEWGTYSTYCSALETLKNSYEVHGTMLSGRTLYKYGTNIVERENLRTYYKDIAVVSVPKIYSRMITGPSDDHFIAWCDYPQADWRFAYNLFIRDDENAKIMEQCSDAYEGLARLVEGPKFDQDEFRNKRSEYKVHCLSTFYNSSNRGEVPSLIRKFFRSCPKYKKTLDDLSLLYKFSLPVPCTSYFGFEQLLSEGAYPDAYLSKGLNTPIQTFTSHVIIDTVFGILEKFWELGYTKEQANVYYVRHDEPLFIFRRDVLKDAWVFKECSEIHIPGFTPISLDFHFGMYYQEEDENLTKLVEQNIAASSHEYTVYPKGEIKPYNPLPSVEEINLKVYPKDKDAIVVCEDRSDNVYSVLVTDAEDMSVEDTLQEAMATGLLNKLGWPQYLLCNTSGMDMLAVIDSDDGEKHTFVKCLPRVVVRADFTTEVSKYG